MFALLQQVGIWTWSRFSLCSGIRLPCQECARRIGQFSRYRSRNKRRVTKNERKWSHHDRCGERWNWINRCRLLKGDRLKKRCDAPIDSDSSRLWSGWRFDLLVSMVLGLLTSMFSQWSATLVKFTESSFRQFRCSFIRRCYYLAKKTFRSKTYKIVPSHDGFVYGDLISVSALQWLR